MATVFGIYPPDYEGSQATGMTGSITTPGSTAAITVGKYRLFKVTFIGAAASASNIGLRFTTGISDGSGHAAPVPTAASPLLVNNQENIFEMSGSIDQIRFAAVTTDGPPATINYSIIPLTRS